MAHHLHITHPLLIALLHLWDIEMKVRWKYSRCCCLSQPVEAVQQLRCVDASSIVANCKAEGSVSLEAFQQTATSHCQDAKEVSECCCYPGDVPV